MPWVWCVCCPLPSLHHCPLWFSDLPTGFWLHICCHGTRSPHSLTSNPTDRARLSRDRPCTTRVTRLSNCLNPSFPSCPRPPVCRGLVRGRMVCSPFFLPSVCWVSHLRNSLRKEGLGKEPGSLPGLAGAPSGWDGLPERQGDRCCLSCGHWRVDQASDLLQPWHSPRSPHPLCRSTDGPILASSLRPAFGAPSPLHWSPGKSAAYAGIPLEKERPISSSAIPAPLVYPSFLGEEAEHRGGLGFTRNLVR